MLRTRHAARLAAGVAGAIVAVWLAASLFASAPATSRSPEPDAAALHAQDLLDHGRQVFRHERMGSQLFVSRGLKLHFALRRLAPADALALGLKVDREALPPGTIAALEAGEADLADPAVTVDFIRRHALVGVEGLFTPDGELWQVGVTCALCHSTVDDSVIPGVGRRLDGWANRDLDVGAVLLLAPNPKPLADRLRTDVDTVRTILASWGPGRYDAHLILDGKGFRPDGETAAVLIPPVFGLAGVNLVTYTGWGSVPYWSAFEANLQMGGSGTFADRRLNNSARFPLATRFRLFDTRKVPDLTTDELAALQAYQLALTPPPAPPGSYDPEAAARGEVLFLGKAKCNFCHVPPLYTEPGFNMHTGEDVGIDDFHAERSASGLYRTTPLRGLWSHTKGGFYHDGRYSTLNEMIFHYNDWFDTVLSDEQQLDLVEYVKSL
jgi:hypothetical protein